MTFEIEIDEITTEPSSTGTCTTYTKTKGRDRNNSPNYGQIIAEGGVLPVNYYKISDGHMEQPVSSWPEPWTYSTSCFDHRGANSFIVWHKSMAELQEQAHAQAVAKLYGQMSEGDFNAAVSAAELPKTMRLVAATAGRLGNAFRHLRRFNVPGAFRALGAGSGPHYQHLIRQSNNRRRDALRTGDLAVAGRDFAANTWLEIKYGWRPLLSEVHAASEALGRGFAQEHSFDIKSTGHGKAERRVSFEPSAIYQGFADGNREVEGR